MLQYGVTRERLRDVLEEAEGWDVIHISGHGAPGELLLETDDGAPDPVTAARAGRPAGPGAGAGQAGHGVGVLVGGADRSLSSAGCSGCPPPDDPRAGRAATAGGAEAGRGSGALATELAAAAGVRGAGDAVPGGR